MSPLCESYLTFEELNQMEPFYPLHVYTCNNCLLVQLEEYVSPEEIFSEYAYFSSYSKTWLEHARAYTDMIVGRYHLDASSHVVEIASNDGYLLQYFVQKGIPVLGIEPAKNIAKVAVKKGIPTLAEFFGLRMAHELAKEDKCADLLIGNNVLAQVPYLNDFVEGMKILLKPEGVITMEFPHLLRLIEGNQFDTIYHEHFSYFSFFTVEKIFAAHSLAVFDVEELSTHGGSLRIYCRHTEDTSKPINQRVAEMRAKEEIAGITNVKQYVAFSEKVKETKRKLLNFLIAVKERGKSVAGYGAPGKGNTLLNYCGIRTDFIDFTVDRNPYKQGKYTPGTHIPIFAPDKIDEAKPDYLLILPWNFKDEIMNQMSHIRGWGGQFVTPIPEVKVYP
jgi:2-polyprenyl-3-methyl-5-hydroxy-6-metoxy-1,4-benzoquinol methylase